jgi:hypothetical protein
MPAPLEQTAPMEVREPTAPSSPLAPRPRPPSFPPRPPRRWMTPPPGGLPRRGSDDGHSASESVKSDRDTEHAASLPTLTPLKEHVQKAFATFAKTVGATKKEIKKAGEIKMDTKTDNFDRVKRALPHRLFSFFSCFKIFGLSTCALREF